MFKRHVIITLTFIALGAASRHAAASCISPTGTKGEYKSKLLFDVGDGNFGASLMLEGGLWNHADSKAEADALEAFLASLGGGNAQVDAGPSDLVQVHGDAYAHLDFFGKGLTLMDLEGRATRSNGSFSKRFTIEVAGIDLYSGANTLSGVPKQIGPYQMTFYTVEADFGPAHASASIKGEIGIDAFGHAASDGLVVSGDSYAELFLEGSAGLDIKVAGVGLFADVDLLKVDFNYDDSIDLTSGGKYDFANTYDAKTLDGQLALKASALGASITPWSDSWSGVTIATRTLYDTNGCVQ
jgi:hypothetical protein